MAGPHRLELNPDDPRRKTYLEMWRLVKTYRWRGTPVRFSDELILAICWEETTFRNIPQETSSGKAGKARGFGQLEPDAYHLMKIKFGWKHSLTHMQQLTLSDAFGVQFIGRVLHTLHDNILANNERHRKNKEWSKVVLDIDRAVLLHGYGGYKTDYAAWRIEAVNCWKKCASLLRGGHTQVVNGRKVPDRKTVYQALTEGMPSSRRSVKAKWNKLMDRVLAGMP